MGQRWKAIWYTQATKENFLGERKKHDTFQFSFIYENKCKLFQWSASSLELVLHVTTDIQEIHRHRIAVCLRSWIYILSYFPEQTLNKTNM